MKDRCPYCHGWIPDGLSEGRDVDQDAGSLPAETAPNPLAESDCTCGQEINDDARAYVKPDPDPNCPVHGNKAWPEHHASDMRANQSPDQEPERQNAVEFAREYEYKQVLARAEAAEEEIRRLVSLLVDKDRLRDRAEAAEEMNARLNAREEAQRHEARRERDRAEAAEAKLERCRKGRRQTWDRVRVLDDAMERERNRRRAENKLREIAQGCLTRASGALTAEQMVWFEPLEEALAQEESE